MAPTVMKCERPGCAKEVDAPDLTSALRLLELHDAQAHSHSLTTKPEKPRRPHLAMTGNAVEAHDWDQFVFSYEQYKTVAGVTKDSASHLLECLSTEVYSILFSTYGREVSNHTEADLLINIKKLVVRQRNTMASIMAVLGMSQDSDQAVLNYIAKLKAAARHCDFQLKCSCGKDNSFTDKIILYKLVAGVCDMELQEELLTKSNLTLVEAEKLAVAKEAAKYSQAALSGEGASGLKSTYKKGKSKVDKSKLCSYCGGSLHSDRKKECPAWSAKCLCGVPHHYQHLCKRKGVPPPLRALLTYRNTGFTPAFLLLGMQLQDFLPSKPNQPLAFTSSKDLSSTWQSIAEWRELALAKRSARDQENLSTHVKEHVPLELGDHVMVQNHLRWSKRGVVVEVLPHRQYRVRMDGSRRITMRNRKYLRKLSPLHGDTDIAHQQHPTSSPQNNPVPDYTVDSPMVAPDHGSVPCPAPLPPLDPAPTAPACSAPEQIQLPTADSPSVEPVSPPVADLMYPTPGPVRRSSRSTKGVTSRYEDYVTGKEFDAASMSPPHGQYSAPARCWQYQYPATPMYSQQQPPAKYPTVNLCGYDVPCPTYDHTLNQIYGEQASQYNYYQPPPCKVFHPDLNKVFVFDGEVWDEFSLETVASCPCQIVCQESPSGGT